MSYRQPSSFPKPPSPPYSGDTDELKRLLRNAIPRLDRLSDRRSAQSLAAVYGKFTERQASFAHDLIARATGTQSIGEDIFAETPAPAPTPVAPPQSATINGEDLEDCVTKVVTPLIEQTRGALAQHVDGRIDTFARESINVIADKVLQKAMQELDARVPRRVEIIVNNNGDTRKVNGHKHMMLEYLLASVANNIPIMLVGAAGSGKTTGGKQVADALGLKFYCQGAASGNHEYLGYCDGAGTYHTTPYREAFEFGGLFQAEELDSGSADVPLTLNSGVDNGFQHFPDRAEPVMRHKDFRIIANANTYGNGADRMYVGRTQLDAATTDRFVFLDWDYDEKLELAITPNANWTRYVQRVRQEIFARKIRLVVSPRASLRGGQLLAAGVPAPMVANMALWKGIDKAQRAQVESVVGPYAA